MIRHIIQGDITAPSNTSDIIIGMNTALDDVSGIGLPFVRKSIPTHFLQLGSVVSFDFDGTRKLHMLICHKLGSGGWEGSERFVRFGLDYLEHLRNAVDSDSAYTEYSIVQIGTGRVGVRDGANYMTVRQAMMESHLLMDLYLYDKQQVSATVHALRPPMVPFRGWNMNQGEELLQIAA